MASTLRLFPLIGLSALALGCGLGAAAAEDLDLRGGWHVVQSRTGGGPANFADVVPPAAGDGSSAPSPATTGAIGPEPAMPAVGTASAVAPATGTARIGKPGEPWCRSGRVAGSGAGFCLIN